MEDACQQFINFPTEHLHNFHATAYPCEGEPNNNKKYRNGARGCALEISVHRIFGYALVVCVKKVNNFSQYSRRWIKIIFGELQKHLRIE